MRSRLLLGIVLALNGLAGCQYYEEYRSMKGDADIKEEVAEMRRAYRLCLQKYEGDPAGQKERCAPYAQAIQDMERKGASGR